MYSAVCTENMEGTPVKFVHTGTGKILTQEMGIKVQDTGNTLKS